MKETDCGAVKIEGGRRMAETIRYLVERGIPVMAHIGLTPQSVNVIGGFKAQGRQRERVGGDRGGRAAGRRGRRLCRRARGDHRAAWRRASPASIPIPTIGIGASRACDGQILVMEDMLGLSPRVPRFVKKFGKVGEAIEGAIRAYAEDVRARAFPTPEHTYAMKDEAQRRQSAGAASGSVQPAAGPRKSRKPRAARHEGRLRAALYGGVGRSIACAQGCRRLCMRLPDARDGPLIRKAPRFRG